MIGSKALSYRDNLNTLLSEILSELLSGVASNAADFELLGELRIGEDDLNDRTTLLAGSTKDSDQLGHGEYV